MKVINMAIIFFVGMVLSNLDVTALENNVMTPKNALKRLMEGNERYGKDQLEHPDRNSERRDALTSVQKPFAIILGCADSRVSPEIVFDQGIGDLFVVRVAGNIVGPIEMDSIEYGVTVLGANLIVVLGHENCGAVNAVLGGNTKDIQALAELIEPSVATVKGKPGNALENAIKANVRGVVNLLKNSRELGPLQKKGDIEIVGGYYNLRSGLVDIIAQP